MPSHTCPASIVVPVVASRRAPVAETPRLFEGGHHIPLLRCKVPVTGASIPTAGTDTHTLSSDRGTSVGAGPTGEGFGFDDVTASGTCNRPAGVSSKPGGVQCAPHHMHAAPTSIAAKLSTRTSREPCAGSPFSLAMGGCDPWDLTPPLCWCVSCQSRRRRAAIPAPTPPATVIVAPTAMSAGFSPSGTSPV